jgi:hypothetical protein
LDISVINIFEKLFFALTPLHTGINPEGKTGDKQGCNKWFFNSFLFAGIEVKLFQGRVCCVRPVAEGKYRVICEDE